MSKLERTTHICLIAVCIVSMGLLLEQRFVRSDPRTQAAQRSEALIGKRFEIPGAGWELSATNNVVLFLNTHCHFCEESMPFYRQVAELRQERPTRLSFSVLSIESPDVVKSYLAKRQVAVDGVYRLSSPLQGLGGTPTLLFVDAKGTIRRVFSGELDAPRRQDVLNILRKGTV